MNRGKYTVRQLEQLLQLPEVCPPVAWLPCRPRRSGERPYQICVKVSEAAYSVLCCTADLFRLPVSTLCACVLTYSANRMLTNFAFEDGMIADGFDRYFDTLFEDQTISV